MFETLDYLRSGNDRQQRAFDVITKSSLFKTLQSYQPLLAGTIPIGVDIETSDLDVLCYWTNREAFIEDVIEHFSDLDHFRLRVSNINGQDTIIVNFKIEEFEIELFGQNRPSSQQEGFRHMLIEHKLLIQYGESLRQEVIRFKRKGMKTEPAFAKALKLEGDPYEALLRLEH